MLTFKISCVWLDKSQPINFKFLDVSVNSLMLKLSSRKSKNPNHCFMSVSLAVDSIGKADHMQTNS